MIFFLVAFALVIAAAHLSVAVQACTLLAPHGVHPAQYALRASTEAGFGVRGNVFHIMGTGRDAVVAVPLLGALCAVLAAELLAAGRYFAGEPDTVLPTAITAAGALLLMASAHIYASICAVGGPYFSFMWDVLVVESAVLLALATLARDAIPLLRGGLPPFLNKKITPLVVHILISIV
jgi:hypothetical protein